MHYNNWEQPEPEEMARLVAHLRSALVSAKQRIDMRPVRKTWGIEQGTGIGASRVSLVLGNREQPYGCILCAVLVQAADDGLHIDPALLRDTIVVKWDGEHIYNWGRQTMAAAILGISIYDATAVMYGWDGARYSTEPRLKAIEAIARNLALEFKAEDYS